MVPTPRLERGTPRSTIWCSNQLSYVGTGRGFSPCEPRLQVSIRAAFVSRHHLPEAIGRATPKDSNLLFPRGGRIMGIDKQSDIAANLQIGPTSVGMVRIYVETDKVELPLDFDPEEAEEIAEELMAAAEAARAMNSPKGRR